MKRMDWRKHIKSEPGVCQGEPCIAGTRVLVSVLLDNLADGESIGAIATEYGVTEADVRAALRYAAELSKGQVVTLAPERA